MMNVLEYASDVNKSVEEILNLCKKLDINCTTDTDMLNEDDIILLDNEISNDNVENEVYEDDEEILDDDELEKDLRIETTQDDSVVKMKKKDTIIKKKDNSKYLKAKKNIYKHKEKLVSNDNTSSKDILYKNNMTVKELADALEVSPSELVKKLFDLGVLTTLNQSLDFSTAEVIVLDYGKELKKEETRDIANFEEYEIVDKDEDLTVRPPVVTIMGHVDHGKTSLLDAIRNANVVEGEAGGITQHIGAYQVKINDRLITFIDTPGHEAFTQMRARGASVTDIVIIIVSAEDGVKPQTREAIDHAKAAKVPIIVAINKMDLPNANPDRVLQELSECGLTPEEWGGDILVNRISAKTKMGINELLENVLLIADMNELKANPNRYEDIDEEINQGKTKTQIKEERKKKKSAEKSARALRAQLRDVEKLIPQKEEELEKLQGMLCAEEVYSNPEESVRVNKKINSVQEEIDSLYATWEELSESLEK